MSSSLFTLPHPRGTNEQHLMHWADQGVKRLESSGSRLTEYVSPLMWFEEVIGSRVGLSYVDGLLTGVLNCPLSFENMVSKRGAQRRTSDFVPSFSGVVHGILSVQKTDLADVRFLASHVESDHDFASLTEMWLWLESAGFKTVRHGTRTSPQGALAVWECYRSGEFLNASPYLLGGLTVAFDDFAVLNALGVDGGQVMGMIDMDLKYES